MTMFPHHLQSLGNKKNSFGGGGECRRYYDCPSFINDDLTEADHLDESRTTSKIVSSSNVKETSESSTSSKDVEVINKDQDQDHQEGWLQLSLGTSSHVISRPDDHQISLVPRLPVELDLLPPGSASSTSSSSQPHMTRSQPHQLSFNFPDFPMSIPTTPSFFLQRGGSAPAAIDSVPHSMTFNHHLQYQNNNYLIRPMLTLSSPPSFSAGQPLHFNSSSALDVTVPPPLRMDLGEMNPPPRPHHSGVWFNLQASLNQTKQPYLPQVPKRYLRIKDGRATVRLLIKYLANKLNLDSEFEFKDKHVYKKGDNAGKWKSEAAEAKYNRMIEIREEQPELIDEQIVEQVLGTKRGFNPGQGRVLRGSSSSSSSVRSHPAPAPPLTQYQMAAMAKFVTATHQHVTNLHEHLAARNIIDLPQPPVLDPSLFMNINEEEEEEQEEEDVAEAESE